MTSGDPAYQVRAQDANDAPGFFTPAYRDEVKRRVLTLAESDERVIAAAEVGSQAGPSGGDRWSDVDLTFGLASGVPVATVLEAWTQALADEFGAVKLFDLHAGEVLYRVHLLPGCLQVDLSFAAAESFGARGPSFRLLYGRAAPQRPPTPPQADVLFGYAVHHALHARICLKRGNTWEAEFWVSEVRRYGMTLACLRRGLPTAHARGYDKLPSDVLIRFAPTLPSSLEPAELSRALAVGIDCLIAEAGEARVLAASTAAELQILAAR